MSRLSRSMSLSELMLLVHIFLQSLVWSSAIHNIILFCYFGADPD